MMGIPKSSPRLRPWRWLVGIVAALILLSAAATQYVASQFGYHPALGKPLLKQVYAPWAWISWWTRYDAQAPRAFAAVEVGCSLLLMLFSATGLVIANQRSRAAPRNGGPHGATTEMTILMPDGMKEWIQTCIKEGGYANISDYVCDLVRRDRERRSQPKLTINDLRKILDEARTSGIGKAESK